MHLYLDSADVDEVRAAAALGYVDGVTMNPALLGRAGARPEALVAPICAAIGGLVSVPVGAGGADDIVVEARRLAAIHEHVVVKIPIDADGLRAMARLQSEGIRTHATLCCSAAQALLAARAGAYFLSPLVGRLEDAGGDGLDLAGKILEIYDHYEFDTRVMLASVRTPLHVEAAAALGADACTMPLALLQQLPRHPLAQSLHAAYRAGWERR